jgi:maltose O-acetyltransferase
MRSEKDKMLGGERYAALDPQLCAERRRARLLCKALTDTRDAQPEERARLIRALIPTSGRDIWIEPPFYCDYGSHMTLGDKVFFNFNCVVLEVAPVRIGSGVRIGPAVQIDAATHPLSAAERRTGLEYGRPVEIGAEVWIGGGAMICPGVRSGARAVIGAGRVVTRDVPAGVFAAGNPCHIVREIGA